MRKRISLLLILTLLLTLCACTGKNAPESSNDPNQLGSDAMTTIKTDTYYPFEAETVSYATRINRTLLKAGEKTIGIADYEIADDGSVSFSGTRLLEIELDALQTVRGVCAGGDGLFYVLAGEPPHYYLNEQYQFIENPDYEGRYTILKYAAAGELLSSIKITDWHGDSVSGIAVGNDGELVIYGGSYISLLNWDGTVIYTDEGIEGDSVLSISLCGKGLVASFFSSGYCLIDPATGYLSQLDLEISEDALNLRTGNNSVTQGLDGEYIANTISEYFSVDFDSGECVEILTLPSTLTQSNADFPNVCRLAEKVFIYTIRGGEGILIVREADNEVGEKTVVKVALYGRAGTISAAGLVRLNSTSSEYVYVYETYDYTEHDRLIAEISSANAPDLVLFTNDVYFSGGVYLDTNSDYFEDLYTYIDADPELSRESFLPNLLEAMSVNGKLTNLWQYVDIRTVAASKEAVGDGKGLTPADYDVIFENSEKYLSYGTTKTSLLDDIATISVSVFTDKESGSCSFDSESFFKLLSWCNNDNLIYETKIIGLDQAEISYDPSEQLLQFEGIGVVKRVHFIGENIGEPYTFVGFPVGDEGCHYYKSNSYCMAIPSRGSNKEGAWEYIRTQLSLEEQLQPTETLFKNTPVNYEALQRIAAADLNDEEYKLLMDLINNTIYVENNADVLLRELIISSGLEYLAGSKTLEETIEIIQGRASIYMSEKYS